MAKKLDESGEVFVILVDRKDYFLHTVGSLRASVNTQVAREILVPYKNLLKNGIVLQADIELVKPNEVLLHGRIEPLRFDYLVIATGSSYAFPGKIGETSITQEYLKLERFGARIRQNGVKNVVIVGGGSVGIELAGEIKEHLPNVGVTLVHSGKRLIDREPRLKSEFIEGVNRQLTKAGVRVELNQSIPYPQNLPPNAEAGGNGSHFWGLGEVTSSTGQQYPTDLLVFTVGGRSNSRSILQHFGHVMENDRLIVNDNLQVSGFGNIFGIGDIAGTAQKRAMMAGSQGETAAKNIIALVKHAAASKPSGGNPKLVAWENFAGHAMIITIGHGGMSQFFNKGESVWGSRVSAMIKSKTLFAERNWSDLHVKSEFPKASSSQVSPAASAGPPQKQTLDVAAEKSQRQIEAAARALGMTTEETKNFIQQGLPPAEVPANAICV